jgi:hypothetical protein
VKKDSWLLSAAVALATILIGMVLVLVLAPSDDSNNADAAPKHATKRSSGQKTSTTTSTTTTTTTLAPAASTTTLPVTGPSVSAATPGAAPTDPQLVPEFDQTDPPDPVDAYEPEALPPGVSSTVTSCTWSPTNGGQLQASGVLTNAAGEDDDWLLSAVWLWRNVNQNEDIDEQNTIIHAEVGQSVPWQLTIGAPTQPPNLSCALEID